MRTIVKRKEFFQEIDIKNRSFFDKIGFIFIIILKKSF